MESCMQVFFTRIILILSLFTLSSCFSKSSFQLDFKNKPSSTRASITNIQYVNHKFILEGTDLNKISEVRIKGDNFNEVFDIQSNNNTEVVLSPRSNISIIAKTLIQIIISDAQGATTYNVNVTMNNGTVTASMLSSMGANSGDYLRYNGTNWEPAAIATSTGGAQYQGSWNASTNTPSLGSMTPSEGDYLVVSNAGTYSSVSFAEGDWVYYDGSSWTKIANYLDRKLALTGGTLTGDLVLNTLLKLKGASNYVTLKASSSLATDLTFTLPTSYGTSGQVLTTDGSGNLSWTTVTTTDGTVTSVSGSGPISVSNGSSTPSISISQAGNSSNGYLSSTDWNTFNGKESAIAIGTTAQYFRGDKTWATLDTSNVPENSNLYFTAARAIASTLNGFSSTNSTISSTDTIVQAFGKAQGQISAQSTSISNKADSTNIAQTITAATITGLTAPSAGSDAANKTYVDGKTPWTVSGNNTYFNTSGGLVGIGTSSPSAFLDVQGGTSSTASTFGKSINLIAQNGLSSVSNGFADGGAVNITAGNGGNPGANRGGNVNINAGVGSNGYPGGQIVLNAQGTVPVQINRSATDNYATSSSSNTVPNASLTFSNGYNFNNQTDIIRFDLNNATPVINRLYFGAVSGQDAVNDYGGNFVWGQRTAANAYAERMRIDARGRLGIGTTTPSYLLQVGNAADGSEARANAWNTLSDERLKKDFEVIPHALEKMLNLNGYYYYWNRGVDKERKLGVKAQEVQIEFPEVVSKGADGFLSVSYNHLVAVVIEAVKELFNKWQDDSNALHAKIAKLEDENSMMKVELCAKDNNRYSFCSGNSTK